jgi:hypothetical protein
MVTFNCNGGLDPTMHPQGASLLMDDLATHKISIAALQKTHTREDRIFDNNDHHDKTNRGILYTIAGKNTNRNKTYGQGFYVDAAWRLQYTKHGYIIDRISYIQFHVDSKKSKTLTIINAYAPTSQYKEEIVQSYYNELKDTHRRFLSKNNTVIIAGDFKEKLGSIFIGYTMDRKPIYARDLNAEKAMTLLLKDAIKPNLVQTLEHNPAIIHGGPFANIAQGTNTIIATKMGMSLSDYVVTEAGFGADLGAEKFLDIKCGYGGLKPKAVVIVATIRALRHHGGSPPEEYNDANLDRVKKGFVNLEKHIENMGKFGLQRVVAINNFYTDSQEEIDWLIEKCASLGVKAVLSKGWAEGGNGTADLAKAVVAEIESGKSNFQKLYDWDAPVKDKIETIAKEIYGADGVDYAAKAEAGLRTIAKLGLDHLPICMAKTQKSFSDNDKLLGRPTGFRITVREFEIAAGAGFLIPILGNMMRMPGLPAVPASEGMDIDNNGVITGLS